MAAPAPPSLLQHLIDSLTPATGSFVGFALGYGLFELSEWRRRFLQRNAIRTALTVELESVEAILSMIIIRLAFGSEAPDNVLAEVRWIVQEGPRRGWPIELPLAADRVRGRDDAQLRELIRNIPAWQAAAAVDLPLPILSGFLSSPMAGLAEEQTRRLSIVKWDVHLLSFAASRVNENLRLSFTVTGPKNQELVLLNHKQASEEYGRRTRFTLNSVREALRVLQGR